MSDVKPKTKEDMKLSVQHLKDRIKFNKAHAKDHLKEVKHASKMLSERGKAHS